LTFARPYRHGLRAAGLISTRRERSLLFHSLAAVGADGNPANGAPDSVANGGLPAAQYPTKYLAANKDSFAATSEK
jgi:hypothetical protein